jgi:hypothetical protein
MDVLKKIPHRHFVFSIPKILRRYFPYDRKLLADLSRCAWESLKVFSQKAVHENDPMPGTVIAMETFGDFLGYHSHTHILVSDGCFYGNKGMFRVAPPLELKKLPDQVEDRLPAQSTQDASFQGEDYREDDPAALRMEAYGF